MSWYFIIFVTWQAVTYLQYQLWSIQDVRIIYLHPKKIYYGAETTQFLCLRCSCIKDIDRSRHNNRCFESIIFVILDINFFMNSYKVEKKKGKGREKKKAIFSDPNKSSHINVKSIHCYHSMNSMVSFPEWHEKGKIKDQTKLINN